LANATFLRIIGPSGVHFVLTARGNFSWEIELAGIDTDYISPADFYSNEWNHVEVYLKTDNTLGEYEVRINGVNVSSGSNMDTQNGTAGVDDIRITNGTGGPAWEIRDFVVKDGTGSANNTWTGIGKHVYSMFPNADTATEDWTQSTGTDSYALIDDVNPDSSTYIESSTVNDTTLLDLTASGGESDIDAVGVSSTAFLDTGSTTENYRNIIRSGSTTANGATQDIDSTTVLQFHDFFDTDPDTGVAWTSGGLDSLQSGVEYI